MGKVSDLKIDFFGASFLSLRSTNTASVLTGLIHTNVNVTASASVL